MIYAVAKFTKQILCWDLLNIPQVGKFKSSEKLCQFITMPDDNI